MSTETMKAEDAMVRRENLKAVLAERGIKDTKAQIAHLVSKGGSRDTYYRDLLGGTKSFGEKAARSIEAALDLPRGYLDGQAGDLSAPAPVPGKDVVHLRDGEYDLISAFRMLDVSGRRELLDHAADLAVKKHDLENAVVARLRRIKNDGPGPAPGPVLIDENKLPPRTSSRTRPKAK